MRKLKHALIVLFFDMVLIGISGCLPLAMANPAPVQINDRFSNISLGQYTEILEDPQDLLTIDEVTKEPTANRFKPNTSTSMNFGTTRSTYWIRFRLSGDSALTEDLILLCGSATLKEFTLYLPFKNHDRHVYREMSGGWQMKSPKQDVGFMMPAFTVSPSTDYSQYIYARVKTPYSMTFQIQLYDLPSFQHQSWLLTFLVFVCLGVFSAMILYNISLSIFLKDYHYFLYVLYMFFQLVYQISLTGAGRILNAAAGDWLLNNLIPTSSIMVFMAALFTREFNLTRQNAPIHYRLLNAIMAAACINALLAWAGFPFYGNQIIHIIGQIFLILAISTGITVALRGYKPAFYFIIAWLAMLIGATIFIFRGMGWLPSTVITYYSMLIAAAMESILLSIALAHRISVLQTEREQAEELYKTLADSSQVGVYITQDRRFQFVNPHMPDFSGYSENEIIGNDCFFFIHPDDRALLRKNAIDMLKGKRTIPYEYRIIDPKGNVKRLMETVRSITYGGKRAVLGNTMDITEHYQMERMLQQAQKMESIGILAGGIAHDFNNILSSIMGYAELCLNAVTDRPKVYNFVEQVLKATDRAKDLVKQIMTFGRMAEHEKRPLILAHIVKEVVKFMRASLPTTIEIKPMIEETTNVIMADPTQMHQVLMNLCTNAGHSMKDTGGVLEIGLKEVVIDAENLLHHPALKIGRYLELSVRDTGSGISRENLEKIFEPYFTTKEKGEGTGLGLAVVHGIVKDHDGEISVFSEVGKGTVFRVYLPQTEEKAEDEKDMEEAVPRGKGETILFVDDEHMIVDANRQVLEQLGYKVVTETDPVKAIEAFKEGRDAFDLVITDKTMPHLTGFDVAREIRSIRADIPVILCSGFMEKKDLEKITTLGIIQLILKPISMSILAKAIRDALDKDKLGQ